MHTEGPVVGTPATSSTTDLLEAVFASESARLERLAGLLVGDWARGQDLVQDVFERAQRSWTRNGIPDSPIAYLRASVVNAARSSLRRQSLWGRHAATTEIPPMVSAESVAVLHSDQQRVVTALCLLPARQRACLVLRFYLDLSDAQIAATLTISLGTAKTHLRRGLAAMARTLKDS